MIKKISQLTFIKLTLFAITFSLPLVEAYKYPGFLKKFLNINFNLLMIFFLSVLYLLIDNKKFPKRLFYLWGLLLLFVGWLGGYLDTILYENFFYSKLHLFPLTLVKSSFFFFFFYALLKASEKDFSALSFPFLILGITLVLHNFNNNSLSNFDFNPFDGAISFLGHFYTKIGLVPYKDFGFPYPPFRILLLGKIFPFISISQRNFIFSLLIIICYALIYLIINKLSKLRDESRKHLQILLLIPPLIFSLNSVPYEPFFFPFSAIYFSLGILFLKGKINVKTFIVFNLLLSVFLWFSNWQFTMFLTILEFGFLILSLILKNTSLFKTMAIKLISLVFGALTLLFYLLSMKALKEGLIFMYKIHKEALPYRLIPLPDTTSLLSADNLFYTAVISFSFLLLYQVKNQKNTDINFYYILSFPLVFLTYALGRSDFPHFIPIYQATLLSTTILLSLKMINPLLIWFILLINIIPAYPLIINKTPHIIPKEKNKTLVQMNRELDECQRKTSDTYYKSIFVTRENYNNYSGISISALYLINPYVPPATPFIHDEVNVQGNCKYAPLVVSSLNKAKKPILTFIEEVEKQNPPFFLPSCGKIEEWLKKSKYKELGKCKAFGKKFTIRVYY